jgi:hypothetical protein
MAEEPENSGQEPNLELPPLLGFGRKRKSRRTDVEQDTTPTEEVAPHGGLAPAAGAAKRLPPVPPPSRRPEATEPTVEEPVEEPVVEAPVVHEALVEQTVAIPSVPTAPELIPEPAPVPEPAPIPEPTPEPAPVPGPVPEPAPVRTRRTVAERMPALTGRVAAVSTGVLVGLVGVVLAFLAGRGCESVRGVGSCGGIGLLALLVIVAVQVVLGAVLLQLWRISDPTSTSFLGVGLVAVFVLLFLLGSLESGWMFVVVPVLSALAFLLSLWITTSFVERSESF